MTAGFSGLNEAMRDANGVIDSNMALEFGRRTMMGVDRLGGSTAYYEDHYYGYYRFNFM